MIYNICYGIGGSALLALFFYFFCYRKKHFIPQKLLSVYVFISAGITNSLLLSLYLPDARHIFITTILSYIFGTAGFTLSLFPNKKVCRYTGRLSFLIVAELWTSIYYTTFYLYHIPTWVNILFFVLYLGLLIAVEVIMKNKSIAVNFWVILSITLVSLFNYCGLITMCFNLNISSILLFSGSLIFLMALIFFIFEYSKHELKHSEPTKLILLTLSQSLISTAGVLIFAL